MQCSSNSLQVIFYVYHVYICAAFGVINEYYNLPLWTCVPEWDGWTDEQTAPFYNTTPYREGRVKTTVHLT